MLKKEFPKGLDCVYESVGGVLFQACVNALAVGGRCIVIGMMEEYSGGWTPSVHPGLTEKLLWKSATVSGDDTQHAVLSLSRMVWCASMPKSIVATQRNQQITTTHRLFLAQPCSAVSQAPRPPAVTAEVR